MSLIYLQKSTNKNGTRDFPSHHSIEIRQSVIFFSNYLRDGSVWSVGHRETRVGRIDLDDGMPISEDGIAEARAKNANNERYDGERCFAGCYAALIILAPSLCICQKKGRREQRRNDEKLKNQIATVFGNNIDHRGIALILAPFE